MPRPYRVTAPDELPATLEEVKALARVDFSDDDAILQIALNASTAHFDGATGVLGRCIVQQTWAQDFDGWSSPLRLPFPDVLSASVTYFDETETEQTVAASAYEVLEDEDGAYVSFRDAFDAPALYDDRSFPVTVTFTAGYGPASSVPASLKTAVMMMALHLYDNPDESGKEPPKAVSALITPYRRVGV